MDVIKRRLSRAISGDSRSSATSTSKARGRRGALSPFNFKKANLSKSLLAASAGGDASKIRELLEGGPELGDIDDTNKAVRIACEKGHLEVLATLVTFGATLNTIDENNVAPLHVAVRHGTVALISLLISNGVNVNIQTKYEKRAPLHLAALHGKDESVRVLLESDCHVSADICDIYGSTPLHLATRMGHADVVKTLLRYPKLVNVDGYDREGWTALHLAAERGDTLMAQILIDHHTQIDCQNKYGRTPLHWATIKGNADMVYLLLQHKASATLKDLHDKCAMDYASVPTIKKMLRVNCRTPVIGTRVHAGSTIGDFIKIETSGSFIRRLDNPLPSVIKCTASVRRKKPDPAPADAMDTIVEDSESRSSSLSRSEGEGTPERLFGDDTSSNKGSLFRSLFTGKLSKQGTITPNGVSRQNSCKSTDSEKDDQSIASPFPLKQADLIEITVSNEAISVSSLNLDNPDCPVVCEPSPLSQRRNNNNDTPPTGTLSSPEEMIGQVQFQTMISKIERHQLGIETIVSEVSEEIGKAASGKCVLSNDSLNNLSNKMHKIQDLIFNFQEDVTQHAELINFTMKVFMDTIRQRLSPRDILPACLYQAFFHAALGYLTGKPHGFRLLIQKMPAISEEKRSDLLETVTMIESTDSKCSQSLYFALAHGSEENKYTPLRGLMVLLTKCQFDQNAAQLLITNFIKMANSSQSYTLDHNNLFILSFRLGEDGRALASHLGVTASSNFKDEPGKPNQSRNLEILSTWRHMNTNISAGDYIIELVEGLIVIGREDLLTWVLYNHQRS